jgi:hypothetical protein
MREEADITGISMSRHDNARGSIAFLGTPESLWPLRQIRMRDILKRVGRCRANGTSPEEDARIRNPHHEVVHRVTGSAVEYLD